MFTAYINGMIVFVLLLKFNVLLAISQQQADDIFFLVFRILVINLDLFF